MSILIFCIILHKIILNAASNVTIANQLPWKPIHIIHTDMHTGCGHKIVAIYIYTSTVSTDIYCIDMRMKNTGFGPLGGIAPCMDILIYFDATCFPLRKMQTQGVLDGKVQRNCKGRGLRVSRQRHEAPTSWIS